MSEVRKKAGELQKHYPEDLLLILLFANIFIFVIT